MDVQTQIYEAEATAASKDLQDAKTKIALNYHLSPDAVNILYRDIGRDYQTRLIVPAIQEVVKASTAKFNAEELITRRETVKDTIINSINNKGTITLPQSIGTGVTFGIGDKWLIGADYQVQNWENYKSFGESDSLANSMQASIGMELTPNSLVTTQRWKRAHYRLGFRYNQTYLKLRNTQLNEIGISFGLGLPLKKSKTTLNFGFEVGQRGTTDNNLIQERFARVIFSLSVREFWFIKRRFD